MGLFGFGGGSGGHVSIKEFKKALWKLHEKGFSNEQIDSIQNLFQGDLHESGFGAGISKEEMKKGIAYLREHPENHHLHHEQIDKLEEALRHYL